MWNAGGHEGARFYSTLPEDTWFTLPLQLCNFMLQCYSRMYVKMSYKRLQTQKNCYNRVGWSVADSVRDRVRDRTLGHEKDWEGRSNVNYRGGGEAFFGRPGVTIVSLEIIVQSYWQLIYLRLWPFCFRNTFQQHLLKLLWEMRIPEAEPSLTSAFLY